MSDTRSADLEAGGLRFRRGFLLLLVAGISLLFLMVIRSFLLSVLLAAVFGGLASPLYRWFLERMRGMKVLAGVTTVFVLMGGIGIPAAGFLALVATEAVQVSEAAPGWLESHGGQLERFRALADRIPFASQIIPGEGELTQTIQSLAERAGPVLLGSLAAATKGTLEFFLQLFVLLYALFFFLVDGRNILRRVLTYVPLTSEQESRLLERFLSVSRATLKGSILIGLVQGGLAGAAFWVAGVPGPALWGTVMVVFSIIPAIGAAFIWIPAVIYLFVSGETVAAVGLLAWCGTVVSLVDNFLRPRLVGRDAKMSDLLILLSTLGGIVLFGAVGFIVGPIVAALFVTIWHIFGEVFHEWLPEVPAGSLIALKEGDAGAP